MSLKFSIVLQYIMKMFLHKVIYIK